MRILSRYVLGQFLPLLGLSFLAFVVVFVVINLVDRLSAFLDQGVSAGAIAAFYACYVPEISVLILPMSMLLASLFCMGTLIRNRELLAMKAAGLSLYQILLPVQIFAFGVSLGVLLIADQVVPRGNRLRAAIEAGDDRPARPQRVRSQVTLRDVDGQVLSMAEYFPDRKQGQQVTLDRYAQGQLVEKITAEEVVWETGAWVFLRGERRLFLEQDTRVLQFGTMPARSVTLLPSDFAREIRPNDQMHFSELRAFINRKVRNGDQALRASVALHLRVAFPFANFVIVLFGLPLASRIRRTGRPLQVGVCLLVSFAYYGCIQLGRAMGWNGVIPPAWGAWGANALFAGLGIGLLMWARK